MALRHAYMTTLFRLRLASLIERLTLAWYILVIATPLVAFGLVTANSTTVSVKRGAVNREPARVENLQAQFARDAVEPAMTESLIAALIAAEPETRMRAAQELGWRRDADAVDALLAATYDTSARVQEQAVIALGEIGALKALPRIQALPIIQGNAYVQTAALDAENQLAESIARQLYIARVDILTISATPSGEIAFAATQDRLYRGRAGAWQLIGALPSTPIALAVAADGQLIYLATEYAGLYRSVDGGASWEHVQFGIHAARQLAVTAVALDSNQVARVYIALAISVQENRALLPLGIAASDDGGATWKMLLGAPTWTLTTRLMFDPTAPDYLFGNSDGGPWRYPLAPDGAPLQMGIAISTDQP
ncbi:MAG: HEAT repeat domain-containing protein [Chloroflexi bacterium]|nr:HEAT repeat domain-containing protein [Chloroflexota bacterium]